MILGLTKIEVYNGLKHSKHSVNKNIAARPVYFP